MKMLYKIQKIAPISLWAS